MAEQHTILGGKVYVYKRPNSSHWQCSSYLAGRNRRKSTKEDSLAKAKEIAEDWYLQLRGKLRSGEIKTEKTFKDASELFLREYDLITQGQRSKVYVDGQHWRSRVHLVPFFGPLGLSEITSGKVQEYRIHRHEQSTKKFGRPPARNTMHQEIVTLRQTLKAAIRHGWLDCLPDLSEPYRASPKISHRAWFSAEEYRRLYEATRKRARTPEPTLQVGIRAAPRLRSFRGEHRPSSRRGAAASVSRRHHRRRRRQRRDHPRDRSAR